MDNIIAPDRSTKACPSCSKPIPKDSKRCPYCSVVVKWALNGKLRAKWQITVMLFPLSSVSAIKKFWLKKSLLGCEIDSDVITLHMGDGTTYKLKRGQYQGSWARRDAIPFTDLSRRWWLCITQTSGERINIDTLLVQYPNGQESIEELVNVLDLKKDKWANIAEKLESWTGLLPR